MHFEDLQELLVKFHYTEAQKQISILKQKSWEVYVEAISGCISLPALYGLLYKSMFDQLFVFSSPRTDMADFREVFARAKHIAVITGAGVSAESGVPTFRGAGGFWRKWQAQVCTGGRSLHSCASRSIR